MPVLRKWRIFEREDFTGEAARNQRIGYYEYIASGPGPTITVLQDLDGAEVGYGAFWGEVQSTVHKGLGSLGVITDGCIRDIPQWAPGFFAHVLTRARPHMSDEHFTVDGTLIEAWASHKSFQRKDGGDDGDGRNFRGQSRTNDTHASTSDPDARLYRRTKHGEAKLAYLGHLLIENRHGLIADAMVTRADGTAERDAAVLMLHAEWERAPHRRRTVGADKGYDVREFIDLARELGATPHVSQNLNHRGGSAIDGRTTRHLGYAKSQHARPRIEPAFGWLKTIAWMRKVKLRGVANVEWLFVFASAAYNILRLCNLQQRAA